MEKSRFFSQLIVLLSILIISNWGCGSKNNMNSMARQLGEKELSKYVVKCGNSWYISESQDGLVELGGKGLISLKEEELTESDKLNGLEFKGIIEFIYLGASRQTGRFSNTWSNWTERMYKMKIYITNQNGHWIVKKSVYFLNKTITCDEILGEKNKQ